MNFLIIYIYVHILHIYIYSLYPSFMYIQYHGYNTLKNHWKDNSFAQAVQQSVLSSA